MKKLEDLEITLSEIKQELKALKEHKNYVKKNQIPEVEDRDGNSIHLGDTVIFLTKGLFGSSERVVYKISSNGNRVTAKDKNDKSVSRAPYNERIKKNKENGERG